MNKTAIKNYAVWARNELIERVTRKAYEYGVKNDDIVADNCAEMVNGRLLTEEEKTQRKQLIDEINKKGFDQVIEEVSYTWFNRFIALRFMEVNNYMPQKVRVFTNSENEFKPQLLDEAIHLDIEGIDKETVFELIDTNQRDELYKMLLLAICNDMGNYLPGMFTTISDYTMLLFPDNLLKEDSVLGKLISDIDEDTWQDQVQAIGWMYQYYISEKHNQVVNILKGKVKKEDIPAATQLWTTDWVVRYMVDNSLGRYWVERNPNSPLKEKLAYLATSKEGNLPVVNERVNPEDITFLDPCMGSGHILVYAFDVLMEIYKECGYAERDAAMSILENNLFGLDIDDRAYQLSYFAVMMKARSYNRRALTRGIAPEIASIQESNNIDKFACPGVTDDADMNQIGEYLVETFKDAKELGALINVKEADYKSFTQYIEKIYAHGIPDLSAVKWFENTLPEMKAFATQAEILSKKFTVVTTNPPYMGKMEGELKKFVTKNYKDYSSDLFAVFMRRNFDMTAPGGYLGFMTPFVWMFIKSYEKLRQYIIDNKNIATLVQMEYSAYEEATVPICSFVLKNAKDDSLGYYYRLSDFKGGMAVQQAKVLEAQQNKDCGYFYEADERNFEKIPGSPVAYWCSNNFFDIFNAKKVVELASPKKGLDTADNDRFTRLWYEINHGKIGFNFTKENNNRLLFKWFPLNSGGAYRKWYGNFEKIINWENDGLELKNFKNSYIRAKDFYFLEGLTWTKISSSKFGIRYTPNGFIFDSAGQTIFSKDNCKDNNLFYILGALCTNISFNILKMLNPTLNYQVGDIGNVPIPFGDKENVDFINQIVKENINLSKQDWDSFETSWDFAVHPLVKNHTSTTSEAYHSWKAECEDRFTKLKANEEELNRIFIDIYGLQDELTPEVDEKDVTVYRVFDNKEDIPEEMGKSKYALTKQDVIKSFISYSVGCMLGRYSLDEEGLAFAGGQWDPSKYKTFVPDEDNIIPICDDEYFKDDIVARFVDFVKTVYGEETLEENLQFIADALGGKGMPKEVIRNYFLNDFYKDHCKTYQKRPIYWMFDSGKKNGFKAIMYLHRYKADTVARFRTKYVFDQQTIYEDQINMLNSYLNDGVNQREKTRITKELKKFTAQAEELRAYEETVHHFADQMLEIDLDDGVKVNYEKFDGLLAKIK